MKSTTFQHLVLPALLGLSLPGAWPAAAAEQPAAERAVERPRYEVAPAASAVQVDAVLDETAWETATRIPLTHEWFPGDNTEPPVATLCLVTFDEENLYVAFRASDPDPGRVRARLADRDTPFDDDTVGFLIDTFDDRRRAFQFRINPLGVQMDALSSDVDASEDWSWDAIWDSAGRITAAGYVVEVAVPLRQLRFPRSAGGEEEVQTWGFLALRDYPRSVRHRLRSTANDRSLSCFVCQFHPLTGFRRIERGRNVELDPTLTVSQDDRRSGFPDGRLEAGDEEAEPGLTASWGITPSVTLNAALNPDFSQVEADSAQLDVNERFALFFPEKRPFFLEGTDLFGTPLPVIFTRTIADPSAGVKLTGKEGHHAFGALVAKDRLVNLIFPGNQGSSQASLDQDLRTAFLRYRRDVGETSTLGVLYTGRDGAGYENQVVGVDGALRVTDSDVVRFQVLGSRTRYPGAVVEDFGQPEGSFGGSAWLVDYQHGDRNWYWFAHYEDLDPAFRADAGFLPRVDLRTARAGVQRTFWGEDGDWYRRLEVLLKGGASRDHSGEIEEGRGELIVTYQGPWQSVLSGSVESNDEYFDGVDYHNFRQSVFASIRPTGTFAASVFAFWGETIDFANSRPADFVSLEPSLELNLGRRFRGELDYVWQELEVAAGRLFTARLTRARLYYHLNRRTFVRAILQHQDVERDAALYVRPVEPEVEELLTQLLFSYEVNPRTVVLVGYSDRHLGLQGIDLTRTGRTFFLKLGYAWLL